MSREFLNLISLNLDFLGFQGEIPRFRFTHVADEKLKEEIFTFLIKKLQPDAKINGNLSIHKFLCGLSSTQHFLEAFQSCMLRKSILDDGRGERFLEIMYCFSCYVLLNLCKPTNLTTNELKKICLETNEEYKIFKKNTNLQYKMLEERNAKCPIYSEKTKFLLKRINLNLSKIDKSKWPGVFQVDHSVQSIKTSVLCLKTLCDQLDSEPICYSNINFDDYSDLLSPADLTLTPCIDYKNRNRKISLDFY